MNFADVKNDVAFRKIFGNKKKTHILVSFLNAVLKLEGSSKILSVKIENPYQFPRIAGEKSSILDVRATEVSGRQFVVEMQVAEPKGFAKRALYYASREYSMQIDKGEKYPKLKPTVFIGILNFKYFKGEDYLCYHSLLDEKTYEHKLTDMRFAFIELPKFKKKEKELVTLIDKWTYFIKNAEKLEVIPHSVDDQGLQDAYKDADKHRWTKEELKTYDDLSMMKQDVKGVTELAVDRAKEEVEAKAKEEAEKKEAALVLELYHNGVPTAIIAKSFNKTAEEINAILEKIS